MNAVNLLGDLIARRTPKLPVSQYRADPAYETLSGLDLIGPAGELASVLCKECDAMHSAAICLNEDTGETGWWCHEAGFCKADPKDIEAFAVCLDRLVEKIADALDCNKRRSTALSGEIVWRIGGFEFQGADVTGSILHRLCRVLTRSGNVPPLLQVNRQCETAWFCHRILLALRVFR